MVGGVPLSLVWALTCLSVGDVDEEADTSPETLQALASLLADARGKLCRPEEDSVIDLFFQGQELVLDEALDAVSKALEDDAELSAEHAEVTPHSPNPALSRSTAAHTVVRHI